MSGWPSLVRRWTANPLILWITRVQIPAPAFTIIVGEIMKVNSIHGEIYPISPFDFSKSINFMNMFHPSEGEQTTTNYSFTKAVYLEGQTMAFKLDNQGTVDKPLLLYTLYSSETINEDIKSELIESNKILLKLR